MIGSLKSELRKLLSVRATYILLGICLALILFFGFYVEGYHQSTALIEPGRFASLVTAAAQAIALFIALVGLLLVCNEYRHNTITYTLVAARSRSQVLLAKALVISLFSVVSAAVLCTAAPYLAMLGLHLRGLCFAPQDLPLLRLLGFASFYVWGYAMIAMLAGFIFRNQVGALAFVLLFPGIEALLGLVLKDNIKYLPFTALGQVIYNAGITSGNGGVTRSLQHMQAGEVVLAYIIGGFLIAWILLRRRDAN